MNFLSIYFAFFLLDEEINVYQVIKLYFVFFFFIFCFQIANFLS